MDGIKNCPFCNSPAIYKVVGKDVYATGESFNRPELFCDSCKAHAYFEDGTSTGVNEEADYKLLEELLAEGWNKRPEGNVDRIELIDHRECVWCRGRKFENRLVKNEYQKMPCSKCDGSGIMGGRVYSASSNPERSIIEIELSYQDDGKTLKVFVSDKEAV